MAVFVLFDGKESYITQDKVTHKYVPIRSEKQAQRFDSIDKANKILRNSISKNIRKEYHVVMVNGDVMPPKTNNMISLDNSRQVQLDICDMEIKQAPIDEIINKFESINSLFMDMVSIGEDINNIPRLLSEVDKKINDVEHYIEFGGNFNAYQGWLCFKILQNLLRQRRQYKNYQEAYRKIGESKLTLESIESLITSLKNISDQKYYPRALPELFRQPSRKTA